jgi:hypothetical protein
MLKLRRGVVVSTEPLTVEVGEERRRAWADASLLGEMVEGDEVIVNVEALDLGLGSGGFDVVHANLTRGLAGDGPAAGAHVMKLNYTPLQHPVDPVERPLEQDDALRAAGEAEAGARPPVLVLPLHAHLAPAAWAFAQARPGSRVGYVQTAGGALPGSLSNDVAELRSRGLLAGHTTAGPAYGGEREAITVVGGLDAAAQLGWQAVICGPGPGILGSATRYGHGGIAALENAHAALALGLSTMISPRLSSADPRPRHRGLSHHTATVLELVLGAVRVPVPEIALEGWPTGERGFDEGDLPSVLDALHRVCDDRHDVAVEPVDIEGYAASGLPAQAMGRSVSEDPLFYAAPLAAGAALAGAAVPGPE